jgi:hypothetical protein
MRTALDAPDDVLDDHERNFVAKIREHGWLGSSVFEDAEGPGFSYSTGFWVSAHSPEVITFSLKSDTAHDVFWDLFRDAKAGKEHAIARLSDEVFANISSYLFPVAKVHYRKYLGWSRWFYAGDEFPCLQLVWPDRSGKFPWEDGFDESFRRSQTDLTERGWLASLVLP